MPFLFQRFPKTTSDSFLIRVSKGHNSFATSFFLLNELLLKRAAGRRNRQEIDINATKKKTQILVRKNKILYYLQRSWKESEQQANLAVDFITMQSASFPAYLFQRFPKTTSLSRTVATLLSVGLLSPSFGSVAPSGNRSSVCARFLANSLGTYWEKTSRNTKKKPKKI